MGFGGRLDPWRSGEGHFSLKAAPLLLLKWQIPSLTPSPRGSRKEPGVYFVYFHLKC